MKITYDKKINVMNITFKKGKVSETLEITPDVTVDVDSQGRMLSLEILDARKAFSKKGVQELASFGTNIPLVVL